MKNKNPIFIIGCPRSGTTLLYAILRASKELWSSPVEAHYIWEKFLPDKRDQMFSTYLTDQDVKPGDREYLESRYHERVYHSIWIARFSMLFLSGPLQKLLAPAFWLWSKLIAFGKSLSNKNYRVIDKTPPNTYRVGFIAKAFPDAKFIYITRDGVSNISSLIEGWKSTRGNFSFDFRKFYDYNKRINIQGYDGEVWKFTNPPGWEAYLNKPLEEVCAFQWTSAHHYTKEALSKIDKSSWIQIKYEDLLANPETIIREICMFIDIEYTGAVKAHAEKFPVVSTATKPNPDKWQKNKELIEKIKPLILQMQSELGYGTQIVETV